MTGKTLLGLVAALALGLTMMLAPPTAAQTDECSVNNIASSLGRTAASIGRADQQAMVQWCRDAQSREGGTVMRASGGKADAKGPGQIAASPKSAEIWCGRNNCVCWKGKKYNGCTNLSACATDLKCVGNICGCTTK